MVSRQQYDEMVSKNQVLTQDMMREEQRIAGLLAEVEILKNRNYQLTEESSILVKQRSESVIENRNGSGIPRPQQNHHHSHSHNQKYY